MKKELEHLKERIRNEISAEEKCLPENIWFFNEVNHVKGFFGTGGEQRIMFVAERPSSTTFGKEKGKDFFYEVLLENNLQEAHLTDLIKSRAKANDPYPKNLYSHWKFFKEEIKIVQPKLIFALSEKVYNHIRFPVEAEMGITVFQIIHYAYAVRYNKKDKFRKQIKEGLSMQGFL